MKKQAGYSGYVANTKLIEQYIQAEAVRDISDRLVKIVCDHKWEKYGHGYLCAKCSYYTGTNSALNKLVKQLPQGDRRASHDRR